MAQKRDHEAMERRRLKAMALFKKEVSTSEVARRLGVRRQSVHAWRKRWKEHGQSGLKSKGAAGCKSRLTLAQEEELAEAILAGPSAAGHDTEVWTLPRLARLIQDRCRVRYHPGHVWHLLIRLGFSCQQPTRRALERDEKKIRRWKRVQWPALKKRPAPSAAA
jgi:transposase